jgi:hypothetical protein
VHEWQCKSKYRNKSEHTLKNDSSSTETNFEFEPPTTTQQKKTKELEEAGIVGKTWTEVKAIAGNKTCWHHFTEAQSSETE